MDQHRVALMEIGAAGRLLMSGELEEVLPLEDAEKLKQAKPITPNGEVKIDPAKVEARHDAQVGMAFKHGPVAVVILGGAHDLKANPDTDPLRGEKRAVLDRIDGFRDVRNLVFHSPTRSRARSPTLTIWPHFARTSTLKTSTD